MAQILGRTPATIPILSSESWMLRLGSATSHGAMVLDTVDRLASDSVWDRTRRLLIPAPGVGRPGPVKKKISQSSTSSDSPIVKVDIGIPMKDMTEKCLISALMR